jgi:hypothetical protein
VIFDTEREVIYFTIGVFDSYRDKALTLAFVPPRGREIACRIRM